MIRKFFDYQLSLVEKGKPLHRLRPLVSAADTFCYEAPVNTTRGPHIRDHVDAKRWIILVVFALLPCVLMAIWNTGVQKMVYTSTDHTLMNEYLTASLSFGDYFNFFSRDGRYLTILKLGAMTFFPVLLISYIVGGFWEILFACVRKHEIAEGFLVTGLLIPMVLPPTIPYWMVAVGVSFGVVIGKELFGGSGMNIVNPALASRAFLFFTFPNKMSGDVWAGSNPVHVKNSLLAMNQDAQLPPLDGYTQATPCGLFNISDDIKRVHVDAIAANNLGQPVDTIDTINQHFEQWNQVGNHTASLGQLSADQMRDFVTSSIESGGLNLSLENYQAAYEFSGLRYGAGAHTDTNFFFGNMLGSMGETSVFACLLGALLLIITGVGAWRTMVSLGITAFLTAYIFQFCSETFGIDGGAWNAAKFAFPAYKHLLIGGLAFGLVFMATDPVSAPGTNLGKWIFGALIGSLVVIIRLINPAFPEAVMLAILLGNVFAPLIDYYTVRTVRKTRRRRRVAVT